MDHMSRCSTFVDCKAQAKQVSQPCGGGCISAWRGGLLDCSTHRGMTWTAFKLNPIRQSRAARALPGLMEFGLLLLLARALASRVPSDKSYQDMVVADDNMISVLAQTGPAAPCQIRLVSCDLRRLATLVLLELYGLEIAGTTYPDYSKILFSFDRLVAAANHASDVPAALDILKGLLDYQWIERVLVAGFGHCIRHVSGAPIIKVDLRLETVDILNDVAKISVVPYALDHRWCGPAWIYFIRAFVRRGRFDILKQLTFPGIQDDKVFMLIDAGVLVPVVDAAIKSLAANVPKSGILDMLAAAGFGSRACSRAMIESS